MYVRNPRKQPRPVSAQMMIIFGFILISTLASVLLPVYFAYLPLH